MASINSIIKYLDDYLEKTGQNELTAVEANQILSKTNLLSDSDSRPGKPLRDLLRAGKFPHAYQRNNRFWYIPHSGNFKKVSNLKKSIMPKVEKKIKNPKKIDLKELKKQISVARNKYKPTKVKCIFIAEAPPDSVERFFYYEDVKKADYLFLGIIDILYPELKTDFLSLRRSTEKKKEILNKLKSDGFYLLDLLNEPIGSFTGDLNEAAKVLVGKIKTEFEKNIPVILIKANVVDLLYKKLISAGFTNVPKERLPFPSTGGQTKFRNGFIKALKEVGIIK